MYAAKAINTGVFDRFKSGTTPTQKASAGVRVKKQRAPIQQELTAKEWSNKGASLNDLGRHAGAINCYNKALEIDPRHVYAWYNKGVSFHRLGRYAEAIECYDKAFEIDPRDVHAWYNKGVSLNHLDHHQETIECYDTALEIVPRHVNAQRAKE